MRTYPFARLGLLGLALASALTGCNTAPPRNGTTYDKIGAELKEATENRAVVTQRQDVLNSLLPPLAIDMPQAPAIEPGQRFDLSVVSAPAQQVLSAIVSGTRYSMVVHPDIKAVISLNLKQVTLLEVLNSVREIYGILQSGQRAITRQPRSFRIIRRWHVFEFDADVAGFTAHLDMMGVDCQRRIGYAFQARAVESDA